MPTAVMALLHAPGPYNPAAVLPPKVVKNVLALEFVKISELQADVWPEDPTPADADRLPTASQPHASWVVPPPPPPPQSPCPSPVDCSVLCPPQRLAQRNPQVQRYAATSMLAHWDLRGRHATATHHGPGTTLTRIPCRPKTLAHPRPNCRHAMDIAPIRGRLFLDIDISSVGVIGHYISYGLLPSSCTHIF